MTHFAQFLLYFSVMVHIFYLGYQVGTCAVYIVFVATNVKDIMDDYKSLNIYIYFGIFFVPFGLIVLVQNLKVMVPISLVATIFTFASFAICLYYIFQDMPNLADRPVFKPVTGFPVFLGITMFAIQAIPVVRFSILSENRALVHEASAISGGRNREQHENTEIVRPRNRCILYHPNYSRFNLHIDWALGILEIRRGCKIQYNLEFAARRHVRQL